MSSRDALAALAHKSDWIVFDADVENGRKSQTYGIQNVACLHVRFDKAGRVVNAIYIHFPGKHRDQFIHQRQHGKRELVERILRVVPESIPPWFTDVGQACGGHLCDGSTDLCHECEYVIYEREIERYRALIREHEAASSTS